MVGYNGAGKTTLIKLIMRLYDPTDGSVQVNNADVKDYTVDSYRNLFSTAFQDYQLFSTSIEENVITDEYNEEKDTHRILSALGNSEFSEKQKELPKGIHTVLTREFDNEGVNLSGGEAQKIAISRVFAKPCDIVILDEPSSSLDPISEYELNKTMLSAAFDKTVILISHRLSTTRMADVIYMLENGQIIETGNHNELMAMNGKYAAMFLLQVEKYNLKTDMEESKCKAMSK